VPTAIEELRRKLTREDFEELKAMQRKVTEMAELLDAVESCGVDCDVYREVSKVQLDRLQNIERVFFSPPPGSV
jgi:hypothetical protein